MSFHFYHRFKVWRRSRHGLKAARPDRTAAGPRDAGGNPAVYAAGIACAGQVGETAGR
jgi:hypothetical protein